MFEDALALDLWYKYAKKMCTYVDIDEYEVKDRINDLFSSRALQGCNTCFADTPHKADEFSNKIIGIHGTIDIILFMSTLPRLESFFEIRALYLKQSIDRVARGVLSKLGTNPDGLTNYYMGQFHYMQFGAAAYQEYILTQANAYRLLLKNDGLITFAELGVYHARFYKTTGKNLCIVTKQPQKLKTIGPVILDEIQTYYTSTKHITNLKEAWGDKERY